MRNALGEEYVELWNELELNTAGGKRFRPRMVFAAYQSLGGTDLEAAAYIGAAFELLHTALIVHDDVIDRDFVRRGAPNIAGSFRDSARGRRERARRTPSTAASARPSSRATWPCSTPTASSTAAESTT